MSETRRKKIANTINTVDLIGHSKEALIRIWELCQDKEALKFVDSRTVIKANIYHSLTDITDNGDGSWSAKFVIERNNVRGNWTSDVTRVIQAAIGISGLQVKFKVDTVRTEIGE